MPIFDFSMPAGPDKQELVDQLGDILKDTVQFKFQAHGAHWNVKGPMFQSFHELFQDIYEDADGAIDGIAELIKRLNADAPIELAQYVESDEESDATPSADPIELSKALYEANDDVLVCIVKGLILATQLNEQGVVNYLADRQDMHEKWQWQLRAIIGDAFADGEQTEAVDVSLDTPDEDMSKSLVAEAWALVLKTHATIVKE